MLTQSHNLTRLLGKGVKSSEEAKPSGVDTLYKEISGGGGGGGGGGKEIPGSQLSPDPP